MDAKRSFDNYYSNIICECDQQCCYFDVNGIVGQIAWVNFEQGDENELERHEYR